MKVTLGALPSQHLPAWPQFQNSAALYRAAGLAIATLVPALFWTFAFFFITNGLDITISAFAMLGVSMAVGSWCLASAAFVMDGRRWAAR